MVMCTCCGTGPRFDSELEARLELASASRLADPDVAYQFLLIDRRRCRAWVVYMGDRPLRFVGPRPLSDRSFWAEHLAAVDVPLRIPVAWSRPRSDVEVG